MDLRTRGTPTLTGPGQKRPAGCRPPLRQALRLGHSRRCLTQRTASNARAAALLAVPVRQSFEVDLFDGLTARVNVELHVEALQAPPDRTVAVVDLLGDLADRLAAR